MLIPVGLMVSYSVTGTLTPSIVTHQNLWQMLHLRGRPFGFWGGVWVISGKKYPAARFRRKILLQGNTWRKKLLHCKKNLSWRLKLEKEPFTIVFQEKIGLVKNGKDWVLVFLLSSRRQVVEMSAAIFEAVYNNWGIFEESSNESSCLKTKKCLRTYQIHIKYVLTSSISK